MVRVLVVEDDAPMQRLLRRALTAEGYAVDTAATGADALWAATEHDYDAVLLDAMLPPPDGFEVARTLRERGRWAPVLMLTARGAVTDRVRGLDAGADDYLTKPFSLEELFARVRSLVRRGAGERPAVLRVGDLEADPGSRGVRRGAVAVDLTAKEFQLLAELLRHPGEVLSRTHLIDHVWDAAYDGASNVVEVHVRRLREKVDRPFERDSIRTVRGAGYLVVDDQAEHEQAQHDQAQHAPGPSPQDGAP